MRYYKIYHVTFWPLSHCCYLFAAFLLYFSASLLVCFLLGKEGCVGVFLFGFVLGRFFDSRRESFLGFRVLI